MFYSKWKKISSQARRRGKESLQFSFVLQHSAQPPTAHHCTQPGASTQQHQGRGSHHPPQHRALGVPGLEPSPRDALGSSAWKKPGLEVLCCSWASQASWCTRRWNRQRTGQSHLVYYRRHRAPLYMWQRCWHREQVFLRTITGKRR